jgi:protein-S-isoprenylcysteine O-methyltransferase Ste14
MPNQIFSVWFIFLLCQQIQYWLNTYASWIYVLHIAVFCLVILICYAASHGLLKKDCACANTQNNS